MGAITINGRQVNSVVMLHNGKEVKRLTINGKVCTLYKNDLSDKLWVSGSNSNGNNFVTSNSNYLSMNGMGMAYVIAKGGNGAQYTQTVMHHTNTRLFYQKAGSRLPFFNLPLKSNPPLRDGYQVKEATFRVIWTNPGADYQGGGSNHGKTFNLYKNEYGQWMYNGVLLITNSLINHFAWSGGWAKLYASIFNDILQLKLTFDTGTSSVAIMVDEIDLVVEDKDKP